MVSIVSKCKFETKQVQIMATTITTSCNTVPIILIKPNRNLSAVEREAKRALQSQVKEQKLRIYWERRIAFAIKCKDNVKLQRAKDELKRLCVLGDDDDDYEQSEQHQSGQQRQQQQHETMAMTAADTTIVVPIPSQKEDEAEAKEDSWCRRRQEFRENKFIETVYEQLIRRRRPNVKKKYDRADTSLLKHMRKGTQERFMFDNVDAIWGYTSCKFCERAMYVVSSLSKLATTTTTTSYGDYYYQYESLWNQLQAVSTVCCIGSGPGNDAVGILSFLRMYGTQKKNGSNEPCLKRMVFLDFAVEQWKVVTDHLESILVPCHVQQLDMEFCDVTVSFRSNDSNINAPQMLSCSEEFDLFLMSFILTETHGQWEDFVLELIDLAKRNALFYFAEPRPWQLHRLSTLCQGKLDFVWIDSSMNNPSLQSLGTRVGPAILLGIKL